MTPAPTAPGASLSKRPASSGRMFLDRVASSGGAEAFRYPEGSGWRSLTWQQAGDRVADMAAGLIDLGVQPGDRVAIACSTRIEWILADLAIACAAGATTTIYPITTFEDFDFILNDSGTKVLIAENPEQAAKLLDHHDMATGVTHVVLIDGSVDHPEALTLAELERRGAERLKNEPSLIEDAVAGVGPDDLATLIYTSGTTGRPKGVRLAHESWTYMGVAVSELKILGPEDVQYLWLPLSHVFGKVLLAVQWHTGFVTAVDGDLDRIVENLGVVKPTFMAGPPRVFEKVRARVTATGQGEGGLKSKIFAWAFKVGIKVSQARQAGKKIGLLLKIQHKIADTLVFKKVRARLGGRIRFFVSGAAALSQPVAEWFDAVGMPILQGYGLTETSAASFVNMPWHNVLGTVGPPLPGTEVKIAEDGEILIKGPGVMRGYHNNDSATGEVLQSEGWFSTGDIGELTADNYLRVTDRKKDLIKTSGGKYVAPQKLEILFKAISPHASQIVVHGEGRKYVSALITVDPEEVGNWAKEHGLDGKSYADLTRTDELHDLLQAQLDELNGKLERWETIKKFAVLDRDLTIEDGDLTPSMKVKRKKVERDNMAVLDELYSD